MRRAPGPSFPRSLREATAAPALAVGQSVALRLRRGQSAVFRLPEGDIAVVTRNLQRGADTVLTLLDAEGHDVTEDDDGGGGLASRLEIAAGRPAPGLRSRPRHGRWRRRVRIGGGSRSGGATHLPDLP